MKLKKAIKKIVALGTGVTMMGATLMGAMAADLGQYPEPFVKDGMFNALLVVGDNAKASDVIGSVDVATSLQYSMKQTTTVSSSGGTTQVSVSGDAVEIGMPGDMLEIDEFIEDNRETLTDSDLEILKDGFISTSEGSTDYEQKLKFNPSVGAVNFAEDDDENVGHFLYIDEDELMFTYELTFSEGLDSDIDDDETYNLEDIEDESITILGKQYSIVHADVSGDTLKLELISGQVLDTMDEGETKTYTIDGVDYEVEVIVISDQANDGGGSVKFRVNDEISDELEDGETDTLSDGLEIGVRDVIPNEAGDITSDLVEFYLGANKLDLEDDYTNDVFESGLEINGESIDNAKVQLKGSNTSDEASIDSIKIEMYAETDEGELFVPAGHGIREYLYEPESLIHEGWDMTFEGLTDTGMTEISFKASNDESYELNFVNFDGAEYSVPLVDGSEGFNIGQELGEEDLHYIEATFSTPDYTGELIVKDDYFILSNKDDSDNNKAVTHVMQFDDIRENDEELLFTDISDNSQKTIKYTPVAGDTHESIGTATLSIGGKEYDIVVVNETAETVAIDLNADDDINADEMQIVTKGGAIISFDENASQLDVSLKTLASEFDKVTTDEVTNFSFVQEGADELRFSTNANLITLDDDDDIKIGATRYGMELEEDATDDASDFTIQYPLSQREAQVFVTAGEVKATQVGSGGAVESVTIEAIEVGSAVLASEVSDVAAQNLIMVGGPCANEAARKAMGITMENCAAGFTPGKAIIKLYDTGLGNVAMLVAGDQAMDTRAAARVLANYDSYDLSGDEVAITYTSLSSITVSEVV